MGGPGRTHVRSGDRQPSGTTPPQPDAPEISHDEGRDSRQSNLAKSRLCAGVSLAGASLVFAYLGVHGSTLGSLRLLLPFVVFHGICCAAAYRLQPSDTQFVEQFDEAVFVAGV